MAVRVQEKPKKAEDEGHVSSCVNNLIEAFTNGLNIFKRLRERRRKHKSRKQDQTPEPINSAELQLSNSLRRGPQDLAERYEECYGQSGMGHRFAKGDSIAHASLAEILIRLNTGLVGIITTFLHHDHKGTHSAMNLNYKSLTDLSEASRRDALTSMSQLYNRLSHSQLQIHPALRSKTPQYCDSSDGNSSSSNSKDKKKSSSARRPSGSHVTRMPIKSSSQPQLCVVRSKSRNTSRKDSVSSSSSITSKPTLKSSSPYASPLQSPVPEYAVLDPLMHGRLDFRSAAYARGAYADVPAPLNIARKRVDSLDVVRPVAWSPYAQPYDYFSYMPEHVHTPTPALPTLAPTPRKSPAPPASRRAPPVPSKPSSMASASKPPPVPASAPMKRRLDKVTPSSYTFASDSTKLGEIPETRWARPWDYEQAEMLNNMAAAAAKVNVLVPVTTGDDKGKDRGRKGLKFWKRGETA
ncbi:uncharacterized protein EKO05_0009452 [Ascochyta rabiei]|uniref:Uncharacterized protein n=1 Tax=Didymella rabiei TaxID=5454 RepID=A0A163GT75_DIDRA|nr:uncharacterized protein EKO05_0009452 [Ascochyta rabiei]KZM25002.1 hypothetical protein ST47_g3877 [Ascochyta rabiei]UPX19183.1 hypothetical protein EKO05_0009452 [Ascochyta rabiei]